MNLTRSRVSLVPWLAAAGLVAVACGSGSDSHDGAAGGGGSSGDQSAAGSGGASGSGASSGSADLGGGAGIGGHSGATNSGGAAGEAGASGSLGGSTTTGGSGGDGQANAGEAGRSAPESAGAGGEAPGAAGEGGEAGEAGAGGSPVPDCSTTGCMTDELCVAGSCETVAQVAVGKYHACAVLSGGTVYCWGSDASDALGAQGDGTMSGIALQVMGLSDVVEVSVGDLHACARLKDGTVACWGDNSQGQLGDGVANDRLTPLPQAVLGITNAVQLAASSYFSCALLADKTVSCWGDNSYGQLGDGTNTKRPNQAVISGLSNVVQIAAGGFHTCAVLGDGTGRCWGENDTGQLGNASTADSASPVTVSGLSGAAKVVLGEQHTCALLSDTTVDCWGQDAFDQLGNSSGTTSSTAIPIAAGITGVVDIAAGGFHNCVVMNDGTVSCWGANDTAQLGSGPDTVLFKYAYPLALTEFAIHGLQISAAGEVTCLRNSSPVGPVLCWGSNNSDQLGFPREYLTVGGPVPVQWPF